MILILIFTLVALFWVYYYRKLSFFRSQGIYGPWPLPFFGNVFQIITKPVFEYDYECFKKFGRIYYDHAMFGITTLVTSDPEMINHILVKDYQNFSERMKLPYLPKYLRRGIIFLENDHKQVRNIISPVFTSKKLKLIFHALQQPVQSSIENFDTLTRQGKGDNVNVKEMMKFFSIDAIARVVFSFNIDSFNDRNNEFFNNVSNLLKPKASTMILASILPDILFKTFKLSFFDEKMIYYFAQRSIEIIKMRLKNPNIRYDDFLQLLMEADSEFTNNSDCRRMDCETIVGQALMFFFAGMETISSSLSNSLYELALNPEIQEKLYEEIMKSYPQSELDYDQIKFGCKYLDMFFKEVLRNNVTISRMIRVAKQNYQFPNGIKVKRNSPIIISLHSLHHDPQIYKDPFIIDPLRFENDKSFLPGSYVPFSDGNKNCVGMRFAYLEVKLYLIEFCKKFRVIRTERTEVPPNFNKIIALNSYDELHLAIERRN